ncbi:MAG: Holliday junction resolvase RuvX [Candidatus Muiribacteriota bacterium]
MKILAIDYGDARLGLAVSDVTETIASPLSVIKNENTNQKIQKIVEDNKIEKIVVGIPSDSEGQDTIQSKKIKKFYKKLKKNLNIEIHLFDENYTTRDAYDILKKMGYSMKKSKKKVDEVAASLILEEYLKWVKNQNS